MTSKKTPKAAAAAVPTGVAQILLPAAAEPAEYPVDVHREFERFEWELWHGPGFHPSLSGVLRLVDSKGEAAGYVYIADKARPPFTGGGTDNGPVYVVVDCVPAQLSALLTLLALPGKKAIRYSKAGAEASPFAAISMNE